MTAWFLTYREIGDRYVETELHLFCNRRSEGLVNLLLKAVEHIGCLCFCYSASLATSSIAEDHHVSLKMAIQIE